MMYYIGLMSGTSADAIDIALTKFENKTILEHYDEYPIDNTLRKYIKRVNEKTKLNIIADLDNQLGSLFADSINHFLKKNDVNANKIIAIGSHGQTILHRPDAEKATSIQIGNPNIICANTGITTVTDFRRMDMAYGGQGAPLASAFHQYQFKQDNHSIVVLNIGGIANITLLPARGEIIGFDTGPGNALLDDWTQKKLKKEYDKNGQWALSGQINKALLNAMLLDPYFITQPPKSTGREYFNLDWLNSLIKRNNIDITAQDIQATLLELTIKTIADAINRFAINYKEVLICGGGTYNQTLVKRLQEKLNIMLVSTEKYGLTPNCIEAITFAWLAKQRIEKAPINLPPVTHAIRPAILGAVYEYA